MGFGGALFALSAFQAVTQIGQGYVAKEEANYNATVLEGQAGMIDVQKGIEYGQYQRLKGQTMSKSMANVAAMGIMPQGSVLAAMLNAQTQINIDQAIGQFNFEQEKNLKVSQASMERKRGKYALQSGYTGALTTMLKSGAEYSMYKGMVNGRTTFDKSQSEILGFSTRRFS